MRLVIELVIHATLKHKLAVGAAGLEQIVNSCGDRINSRFERKE